MHNMYPFSYFVLRILFFLNIEIAIISSVHLKNLLILKKTLLFAFNNLIATKNVFL